jgi:hypothetical protein
MPVTTVLLDDRTAPASQQLADRAKHMRALGTSYRAIGRALCVDYKVAIKAVAWRSRSEQPSH